MSIMASETCPLSCYAGENQTQTKKNIIPLTNLSMLIMGPKLTWQMRSRLTKILTMGQMST